jgi:membrane-associated protein
MDFSGIAEFFKFLLDSEDIINYGGLALIVLIVYMENGFFFAFFLPGGYTGYFFGRLLGKNLERRKDSLFFKKEYLVRSRVFFAKYGGKALILARFMPIVRTFSPIVAGTILMNIRTFSLYNVLGALAWGVSLPVAGYYLGQQFPQIINYVEYIIVFFIGITSIALIRTLIGMKKKKEQTAGK